MKPITVFNADDHPMLKKGISNMIIEYSELEWVGSAENGKEALEKILNIKPDVAILDIEMPYLTGLEVAKEIIDKKLKTKVILLTLFKDKLFLKNAISLGVKGYLLKESSEKDILECILSVNQGKIYINPQLTHLLLETNDHISELESVLSKQEINILKLISQKNTSAEIADKLFISSKTVNNHRSNISKKLQLPKEQNNLLKWAIENKDLLS